MAPHHCRPPILRGSTATHFQGAPAAASSAEEQRGGAAVGRCAMGPMPTPPHHPPASLQGRTFTLDDARAAGLTRGQLSGRAYGSEGRSLWSCTEHREPEYPPGRVPSLALPAQAVTPGAVISHVTAAQVLGLRLSKRLRGSTAIHLTQTAGRKAPRRVGVVGHRALLVPEDVVMRAGMRVTGPTRTAVDLAGMTRGRGRPLLTDDDLLVLLEGIIDQHSTGPRAGRGCLRPLEAMATDLRRISRVRGVARVRQGLERALPAVDSALETRMRLLLEAFGLRGVGHRYRADGAWASACLA